MVGSIRFGSTKWPKAWSTSCGQSLSASVSTPRSVSQARSSTSSRVHSSCASSDSTKPMRFHGRFRSMAWPRNVVDRCPACVERDSLEQLLDPVHRVVEVGVRLVPFEHRELGLVLVRDALVAEVLADLVHPLEAADDEPLEVELGRDSEVEVGLQLVRVRDERVRERSAVARLQHRRLHLDEALGVEVAPDRRHDLRAQEEDLARVLVHEQVEVALAIAGLRVGETVERVRKGAPVPREDRQLVDRERRLASSGLRGPSRGADDVAQMHVDVARAAGVAHELDAPGAVDQVEEDELPHLAARHDAPGETSHFAELASGVDPFGRGANVRDRVPIRKSLRRRHVGQPNRLRLRPPPPRSSARSRGCA